MSLADNARRAQALGLSYGKYMSLYGKSTEQVISEAEARKNRPKKATDEICYMAVDRTRFLRALGSCNLTQKKLAEISGCAKSTIGHIAGGRRTKLETLQKLAKAMKITVDELVVQEV